MKRLMEKIVFSGFTTAWRLAGAPTSRSPVLVKPTTERHRPTALRRRNHHWLAAFHHAITEFVVPKSIPTTLPIVSASYRYFRALRKVSTAFDTSRAGGKVPVF
jgi:hypothetical protein